MKDYRLYFLNETGGIRKALNIRRPSDAEAIDHAHIFANKHGLELWEGARKVAEIGMKDERPK